MADSNASPRQKMINMMYLVLTALLALNVSAEILKAFHLVESSMERAGVNMESKNKQTLEAITKYKTDHPADPIAIESENSAKKAEKIAAEAVKYFQDIKADLISKTGGYKEDSNHDGKVEDEEIVGSSNVEVHANIMIVQGKGTEVKNKINQIRQDLINCLPKDKQGLVKSDLVTPDPPEHEGKKISWESEMFEHPPLAAVNTLLTKMQNDVRNTEAQVLDILQKNLTGDVIVIDNFKAQIIPTNGTYVSAGSKYTADIFLGAASSNTDANITVNGAAVKTEGGIGKYEVPASGEGEKKLKAVITTRRASGKEERYEQEFSYTVVKPIAVISATKMNVVYVGLDNPITVSVPGYAASQVTPSVEPANGGSLTKSNDGGYILKVTGNVRELKIVCTVKDNNGSKRMGEQPYRVKSIPSPTPMLGTIEKDGSIASSLLKAQTSLRTPMIGFAYEGVTYSAYQYKFAVVSKKTGFFEDTGKSPALTDGMKAAIAKAQRGDKVMIYDIRVKGPDGNKQLPGSLLYVIQ